MIDLNNLKTQITSIFDAANTTTATQDLSEGMETRVQRVLRVNPERIPIQADWHPFVTVWIESKELNPEDFAVNQTTAKRRGEVAVKIAGCVWNSSISDEEDDPADDDCEKLMENLEEVLRANPTLNGLALWSFPTRVTYHNRQIEEGVHIRAGILHLVATVFY